MNSIHKAIFPAILVGSIMVVVVTSLIANPQIVLASSNAPAAVFAQQATPVAAPEEQLAAKQVVAADPSGCTLPASVPGSIRQWCEPIERHSNQVGLAPSLIAALITQESAGDPQAYSHSGAVGLMQVMPRDGLAASFQCVAGPCFADRPSTDELFNPEFNIQYGTQMLADLLQRNGNLRDALKAYGPHDRGYEYADIVLGIFNNYQ